jgi:hypothetical protein
MIPGASLMGRVLVWYSDGAASAVAAKLALEKYGPERVEVLKCDTTADEHLDNFRFRKEVEAWLGVPVILLRSPKYAGVDDVIAKRRYMSGISGAPCTHELKKAPRLQYQKPDDVHVFGYTLEEVSRAEAFTKDNMDLSLDWILISNHIRKKDCLAMLERAGILSPAMYSLGFDHNNCLGCVKASSPAYWNRIRLHFPDVFQKRAEQSRALGVRLVKLHGERIFLDELPEDAGRGLGDGNIECGPFCQIELNL